MWWLNLKENSNAWVMDFSSSMPPRKWAIFKTDHNIHTVSPTWKVTILNPYCGYVFRVTDLPPLDLCYKFTSILFSGKMFRQIQFLNFASFLRIFIEGGMVKLENWWQNFPFFIPYIKMDMNSLLESHIKKFLSYLSKPQYWFKIVTLI